MGVDCKSCLWGSIFNRKLLIDSELTKHYTESVANIKYPEKQGDTSKNQFDTKVGQIAETGKPTEIKLESRTANYEFYFMVTCDSIDGRDQAPLLSLLEVLMTNLSLKKWLLSCR